MCIIAVKEVGKKPIDEKTIREMYKRNPDGAGLAVWSKGRGVVASKGYMDVESFLTDARKVREEDAAVFHFRIKTHGEHAREQCHPFPVTDNVGLLEATAFRARSGYVLAHNGVFSGVSIGKEYSDTQAFIALVVEPLRRAFGSLENPDVKRILERCSLGSRVAILNAKTGDVERFGNWEHDAEGRFYSNSTFKPAPVYTFSGYAGRVEKTLACIRLKSGEYEGVPYSGEAVFYSPALDAVFVRFGKYAGAVAYESINGCISNDVDFDELDARPTESVRVSIKEATWGGYYD